MKYKGIIEYENGDIYQGWIKSGKRTYIGKLFLRDCSSSYYFGIWSKNELKFGQFVNTSKNQRFITFFRNKFKYVEHDLCSICLELKNGIDYVLLSCNHTFCIFCIKIWFRMSTRCPVCRKYEDIKVHKALSSKMIKFFTENPIVLDIIE